LWFPITFTHTIVTALIEWDLLYQALLMNPGSLAGSINSPYPSSWSRS